MSFGHPEKGFLTFLLEEGWIRKSFSKDLLCADSVDRELGGYSRCPGDHTEAVRL
jgi:hypothetical protein